MKLMGDRAISIPPRGKWSRINDRRKSQRQAKPLFHFAFGSIHESRFRDSLFFPCAPATAITPAWHQVRTLSDVGYHLGSSSLTNTINTLRSSKRFPFASFFLPRRSYPRITLREIIRMEVPISFHIFGIFLVLLNRRLFSIFFDHIIATKIIIIYVTLYCNIISMSIRGFIYDWQF